MADTHTRAHTQRRTDRIGMSSVQGVDLLVVALSPASLETFGICLRPWLQRSLYNEQSLVGAFTFNCARVNLPVARRAAVVIPNYTDPAISHCIVVSIIIILIILIIIILIVILLIYSNLSQALNLRRVAFGRSTPQTGGTWVILFKVPSLCARLLDKQRATLHQDTFVVCFYSCWA